MFVLLLLSEGGAQIPQTITYQGRLNGQGGPVSGTLAMTFAIYDQKTGSALALWTETHASVTVDQGQFLVELGSVTPFDSVPLTFDVPYFLGIRVDPDPDEMHPRLPFTSVGYALNSVHSQSADHAGNADHSGNADDAKRAEKAQNADRATNADKADKVVDGSITEASLSPNICNAGEVLRKTATGWACNLAVGPAGPTGAQGVQGPVGPSGARGPGSGDFKNIAIVTGGFRDGSPVTPPGLYTDPVAAMGAVGAWCGVPDEGNRCLLKIMPGVYDVGASALVLRPFVTVTGSGQNATRVRGSGGVSASSPRRAVVFGADNAELRSLTIEGTGAAEAAIVNDGTAVAGASAIYADVGVISRQIPMAVFNHQSSPMFNDVTIESDSVGIRNDSSTPSLTDVTIAGAVEIANSGDVLPGGPANEVPVAAARVRMANVTIRVSGGDNSVGLMNDQSHVELTNVRIEVSGPGQMRGVAGTKSRITMADMVMTVEGAVNSEGIVTTDSYVTVSQSGVTVQHGKAAVDVSGTQGFLVVGHSALANRGGSAILKSGGAGLSALLGQTKVVGTVPPGLTCANVYDGVTYQPVVCHP